jgi:hypothetical protein
MFQQLYNAPNFRYPDTHNCINNSICTSRGILLYTFNLLCRYFVYMYKLYERVRTSVCIYLVIYYTTHYVYSLKVQDRTFPLNKAATVSLLCLSIQAQNSGGLHKFFNFCSYYFELLSLKNSRRKTYQHNRKCILSEMRVGGRGNIFYHLGFVEWSWIEVGADYRACEREAVGLIGFSLSRGPGNCVTHECDTQSLKNSLLRQFTRVPGYRSVAVSIVFVIARQRDKEYRPRRSLLERGARFPSFFVKERFHRVRPRSLHASNWIQWMTIVAHCVVLAFSSCGYALISWLDRKFATQWRSGRSRGSTTKSSATNLVEC